MKLEIAKRRTTYTLDTFVQSWLLTFKQFFPLFGAWFISVLVPVVLLIVGVLAGLFVDTKAGWNRGGFATLTALLFSGGLLAWLWAGWNLVCLKVARGIDVTPMDLLRPATQVLSAAVVLVVTTSLISLGSLLVIPGALLFLKWQLAPFYIVDRNFGPWQALKQSWEDTKMIFVPLAMLDLLFVLVGSLTTTFIFGPLLCNMGLAVASAIVYAKWLTDENNPDLPQLEDDGSQWSQTPESV